MKIKIKYLLCHSSYICSSLPLEIISVCLNIVARNPSNLLSLFPNASSTCCGLSQIHIIFPIDMSWIPYGSGPLLPHMGVNKSVILEVLFRLDWWKDSDGAQKHYKSSAPTLPWKMLLCSMLYSTSFACCSIGLVHLQNKCTFCVPVPKQTICNLCNGLSTLI